MGETLQFSIDHGRNYDAYLAKPASGSGPGIVVIQEWWGLVDHIKDIADRFAASGFVALAPDFYAGEKAEEPEAAAKMMMALNIGEAEAILRKAILTLLADSDVTSEGVGVVGFCMGGQLALFAAGSNNAIHACVDFYGIHPNVQPSFRDINGPVLGIFAENDHNTPREVVESLDRELTILDKPHEFVTYENTDHAFFNDTRPEVYNEEAATDAWHRTISFFREYIR